MATDTSNIHAAVLDSEVNQIRIACQTISREYKPTITYIVCGKRHHISLFPKKDQDGDRTGNVKAGVSCFGLRKRSQSRLTCFASQTTIDTDITSPFQFDWYTQVRQDVLRLAHLSLIRFRSPTPACSARVVPLTTRSSSTTPSSRLMLSRLSSTTSATRTRGALVRSLTPRPPTTRTASGERKNRGL